MKIIISIVFILINLFSFAETNLILDNETKLSTNFLKATYFQIEREFFFNTFNNEQNSTMNFTKAANSLNFVLLNNNILLDEERATNLVLDRNFLSSTKDNINRRKVLISSTVAGALIWATRSGINNINNGYSFTYRMGRAMLPGAALGALFGLTLNLLERNSIIKYKRNFTRKDRKAPQHKF